MIRRIGETSFYRAESPSQTSLISCEIDLDEVSLATLSMSSRASRREQRRPDGVELLSKQELVAVETNICQKLLLIIDLVADFANDAQSLYESAQELLKELRTKIFVYLQHMDIEMSDVDRRIRHNVDRSTINDDRINWLLYYTKCHRQMRRLLSELFEQVCEQLENTLELRAQGVIGNKPNSRCLTIITGMQAQIRRVEEMIIEGNDRGRA